MDYKTDCKSKSRLIAKCSQHKFSIDAILGSPRGNLADSNINRHSGHLVTGSTGIRYKTEQQACPYPYLISSTEAEDPNQKKLPDPSFQRPTLQTRSPVDRFWQTLSRLNASKTNKSHNSDSTRPIGPELTKNRSPRIPFSRVQLQTLEKKFQQTHYLSGWEVNHLAKKLNLSETRVKIWFQNRRARERRDGGILNSPESLNVPSDYTASDETDINMANPRWQSTESNSNSNSVTLNSCIDSGPLNFTNPTDVYPTHLETSTISPYVYHPHQPFGFPLKMPSSNRNFPSNSAYHSIRPIYYPLASSSAISPSLPYQPITEQSFLNQTSFWRPYNYDRTLEISSCTSNLVTCTAVDEKQFS